MILLQISCYGSILNPTIKDYYGQKKHIKNEVIILVNIIPVDSIKNGYSFEFYEPIPAANPVRKKIREENIRNYYNRLRDENNFGPDYHVIRSVRRTIDPFIYNNIVIYTDSSKQNYTKKIPGLINFRDLMNGKPIKF